MRLPDFLCIGAQKAATKWFYAMLQQHPNVWMPPFKELHFFDRIMSEDRTTTGRHRKLAEKHKTIGAEQGLGTDWSDYLDRVTAFDEISLDWYREAFSWPVGADVKIGDITPAYLEIPEANVRYARELLDDIKIMAIIRRPLDRELSQLRMAASRKSRKLGVELQTVEDWMKIYDPMVQEYARGSYSRGIPLWQGAFSEKNFLAIPFGDVREAPLMMMKRVEDFLEIPNFGLYEMLSEQLHKTKKLEIPQEVIARAADRVADEDRFLVQHFGEEFFKRTK